MYLEHYYLLPDRKYKSLSPTQYYKRLSDEFCFCGDTSSIRFAILTFGYFCKYFSAEELLLYLGFPDGRDSVLRSRLNDYVNDGYLRTNTLAHEDSCTSTLYSLTDKGYLATASLFATEYKIPYRRRGKAFEVMHSYSTGMNLFAFLSSPYITMPFTWQTEVMLSGKDKSQKNALCADAYVRIGNHNIFIEEDLLNEANGTLIHKFEDYVRHSLMNRTDDMIILSCKQAYQYVSSPAYSRNALKKIAAFLKSHPDRGLFDLDADKDVPGAGKALTALREVLTEYHHERACMFLTEDLERYIKELDGKCNPYRIAAYNKEQIKASAHKRYSLFGSYRTLHRNPSRDTSAYLQMLNGFPLYVMPTSLTGSHMYVLFRESGMEKLAYRSLYRYFPEMAAGSRTVSDPLPMKRDKAGMRLRNCFSCAGNGNVCVEFLSIDLGAMIRAYHFFESVDIRRTDMPYHLVLVVETVYDAARFCEETGYRQAFLKMNVHAMTISFILRRDLGKHDRMFMLPAGNVDLINYYEENI